MQTVPLAVPRVNRAMDNQAQGAAPAPARPAREQIRQGKRTLVAA
jgi:hypothetical protein